MSEEPGLPIPFDAEMNEYHIAIGEGGPRSNPPLPVVWQRRPEMEA